MALNRRAFLKNSALTLTAAAIPSAFGQDALELVPVTIDTRGHMGKLSHIWEACAGSDRAEITLRESWRGDLDRWHNEVGLKRVRFHGIFNDELGVYAASILNRGKPEINFQNIDRVYDGLVSRGVDPYVELSFMPKQLASADRKFGFYGGNISPPKSNEAWADFIRKFVVHLVDRYGLARVKTWPFEVWNEANLPFFWSGKQADYFEMYKATAVAIKSVDENLLIGGPATARAEWLPAFAAYCADNNAPVDFFSTHTYAGDDQATLFGHDERYPQVDVIPEAMRRARQQIDASAFAGRPLWLSEWSSDSPAMIAHVVSGCLAHCQAMSHWTLSSTYEELGVSETLLNEGYSGFGAMVQGIAKPAFNTYKLLHALGNERLAVAGPALATRRGDRSVAALVWNLADVKQPGGIPDPKLERSVTGEAKRLDVVFAGAKPGQHVQIRYVDQVRGSPMPAWREMGSPQYPTLAQIALLRQRADIAAPEKARLDARGRITLELPPEGVALIEFI